MGAFDVTGPRVNSVSTPPGERQTPAAAGPAPSPAAAAEPGWRAGAGKTRERNSAPVDRGAQVSSAILSDNHALVKANAAGAKEKFEALTESPFRFFRGTAGLFYRDLEGQDIGKPEVTITGDVHPENFGVIEGADKKLFFGVNDFDETTTAPYSWDLKRGATAFELAARQNKLSPEQRAGVMDAFLDGYRKAIADGASDKPYLKDGDANGVVQHLFDKAKQKTREDFLSGLEDPQTGRFATTDELKPMPQKLPEMKEALKGYLKQQGIREDQVVDVAAKLDSGTASLGSDRFYVLIKGGDHPKKDHVLEVKAEQQSAAEPYTGRAPTALPQAERVVRGQQTLSADGDPYYGAISLGGQSYLVRERNPHKEGVKLSKLDPDELAHYAKACGEALGASHARSGKVAGQDAYKAIEKSFDDNTQADIKAFANGEADRVTADYTAFKGALKAGTVL